MYKRLYRSKNDVKIAGVCSGIAEYYQMDPTMVRLLVAFVGLLTAIFPLILLYFIAWIIVPIEE